MIEIFPFLVFHIQLLLPQSKEFLMLENLTLLYKHTCTHAYEGMGRGEIERERPNIVSSEEK